MAVLPRRPKGPPLNALRAFEASARLESFVLAAEELGVTAGAISQHVKAIENWAQTELFQRNARGISLSPAGRALRDEFTQAFDMLAAATQSLKNQAPNPSIHIAALPSIAQLWLPERLGKLREQRPDLTISVTAMESPPKLGRDLFDLSVFFETPEEGPDQVILAEDIILPVAAPIPAENLDLESATLLHDQTWKEDWATWSEQTGYGIGDPARGQHYSLYALAVEEAKSGAGVLMGHACLLEPLLSSGQLVVASRETANTGRTLMLTLPPSSRRHPEIDLLVNILRNG